MHSLHYIICSIIFIDVRAKAFETSSVTGENIGKISINATYFMNSFQTRKCRLRSNLVRFSKALTKK